MSRHSAIMLMYFICWSTSCHELSRGRNCFDLVGQW